MCQKKNGTLSTSDTSHRSESYGDAIYKLGNTSAICYIQYHVWAMNKE